MSCTNLEVICWELAMMANRKMKTLSLPKIFDYPKSLLLTVRSQLFLILWLNKTVVNGNKLYFSCF